MAAPRLADMQFVELSGATRTDIADYFNIPPSMLSGRPWNSAGEPIIHFTGDSDAHIVKGLIAVLLKLYSGRKPDEIVAFDANAAMARLGLPEALSSQRANGLNAMIERIRGEARAATAP